MTSWDLRYAATDCPDGTGAVVLSGDRVEAAGTRARHPAGFWCTTAAGGCGGVLDLYLGKVRVPHFQHRRDAGSCALGSRSVDPS